ncbi:MAG TPA: hypothetical protein PKM25_07820, partial [Candidatus Ozemobacteraceae bacterium]|nr:hypothetical protein [Candidatus Ozemobacteraceae bacterium]
MIEKHLKSFILCLVTLFVFFGISSGNAQNQAERLQGDARFLLTITKFGTFLDLPEKEPLEIFRRLGRMLAPSIAKYLQTPFDAAGFVPPRDDPPSSFTAPVPAVSWSESQRAAVENFRTREQGLLKEMTDALPFPNNGFHLIALLDPRSVVPQIQKILENPETKVRIRPDQLSKIETRILPFLQMADAIAVAMRLTPDGFSLEIHARGGEHYKETMMPGGALPSPLSCSASIDPNAFLTFAQVHPAGSATEILQMLHMIPQTAIVEKYLASAGLDFERDILSNPGIESFANIDLTPVGDGGLPDLRAAVKVKDPVKLVALAPQLKQLAMSVGVMVTPNLEQRPSAKISYFLLPVVSVHIGMTGDLLLIATSRDSLFRLAERIEGVAAGKIPGFAGVPSDAHRFWKIRFSLLNEQLQKLLQSPLLADKGIPPFSNLNITSELG